MEKEKVRISPGVFVPVKERARALAKPSTYVFEGRVAMIVSLQPHEFVSGLSCLGFTSIGIITKIEGFEISVWSYEDIPKGDLEEISNMQIFAEVC